MTQAPIFIGEFGTGNLDADLFTAGSGSQGQWMTSIVNFIASSYDTTKTTLNDSGVGVSNLHWSYWTLNTASYGVLGQSYQGLQNPKKEYTFLCFIQQGPLAVPMGSTTGRCGSTGTLPLPDSSAPPPVVAPSAPTGLTATAGDARVTLTWNASDGATSYTVRSNTTGGEVFDIVQSGVTATTFVHTGLTNGVTYSYMVSATNSAGESGNSNQASATPMAPVVLPPAAPTGVTATPGDAQVQVSWTAVTGATSYTVKYATTSTGPYEVAATDIGLVSFTHTGLTNGTTYYYVVSAANAGGTSPDSSQVSATPVAPTHVILSIWWPTDGATLSGSQPFKAKLESMALSAYKMYWHVEDGSLHSMYDSTDGGPHKEDWVRLRKWSIGPHRVTFVAYDLNGALLAQKSVAIYVAR